MTGPANCKNATRHYAHLSLCSKSSKTNDAKSKKWPKASIWVIFWQFPDQLSPNCKFFWKIDFIQLKVIFSTNFRPKAKKIVWALFEKNIWFKKITVWFWANLETFSRISANQEFFSKIRLCDFSTFTVP